MGSIVRKQVPQSMLHRLTGPLSTLLTCGIACEAHDGVIELRISAREAASGGMVTVTMPVLVRRRSGKIEEELFSAWLTIPPAIADGTVVEPSVEIDGMLDHVVFRVRVIDGR